MSEIDDLRVENAELEAEVERLNNRLNQDSQAFQIECLKAEVEWLRERERLYITECASCGCAMHLPSIPPHCSGCTVDEEDYFKWEDRVQTVYRSAEAELLRAHSWERERAAVVAMLEIMADEHRVEGGNALVMFALDTAIFKVKHGKHWQSDD
jgi:hypothetical protein